MRTMTTMMQAVAVCGVMLFAGTAANAQSNPCNPCNPCGGKAKNPCNPCGGKGMKGASHVEVPVNPCHAKMGKVFYVSDPMQRNQVTFESIAPLEDIVGTTNAIHGYAVFNPSAGRRGVRGKFVVPVKTLNTGIPLRDEHLKSGMWLDAENYPDLTFKVDEVRNARQVKWSSEFQTYNMTLVGPFTIHGVTKEVEIPARVTYLRESEKTRQKMPGNLLAIRAEFDLELEDFNINGPPGQDLIGSKVGESVTVEVSLFASDQKPSAGNPCNPCNPCGGKAGNPCNPCGG